MVINIMSPNDAQLDEPDICLWLSHVVHDPVVYDLCDYIIYIDVLNVMCLLYMYSALGGNF